MNNPIRRKSKHIVILNLLPLIILIISLSLSTVVSSSHGPSILHKTQRFTSVVDTLNQTISKVNLSFSNFSDLRNRLGSNLTHRDHSAFQDCLELLEDTVFDLTTAILELRTPSPDHHNVKMLLSAAMKNTRTCLDGFASNDDEDENSNSEKTYGVAESLKESLFNISSHARNSLAMLDENIPGKMENYVGFPTWVDHKLLQTQVDEIEYNLVVDQNGTGNFTTIKEAVSAAPNASETRYVGNM